jgi:peptidyl-prolyl cis-trans isomerase C
MRRLAFAAALGAGVLCTSAGTRADDPEAARRAQVVAHVGPTRTITVAEEEDRIAALPPFQRTTFGQDADTIRRAFLMQVLLPDSLFGLGAEAQKLDSQQPAAFQLERARSQATIRAVRDRIGPASDIPMSVVQGYYDENRARYDTPERYQIWRILCKTEDEAKDVLAQASKSLDIKTFGDLAREHSLDKATNLRAGNLGFLSPDGVSNEPGLKVDPAVVRAAQGVRDGQLVPAPVPEGDGFSVVWRHVAAQIRDTLWKARVKEATDKLVASLRASKLRDFDEGPLYDLPATLGADAGGPLARRGARDGADAGAK